MASLEATPSSTAPSTLSPALIANDVKKRTRTRRRAATRGGAHAKTPNNNSGSKSSPSFLSGNVSESSEESKRSLQRQQAPKKARQPLHETILFDATQQAHYLAMDCEMVGVGEGGMRSALARVTVVNWAGDVVYDRFVRPTELVTDYRTFVSGITADDLVETTSDDDDDTDTATASSLSRTTSQLVDMETCRDDVSELIRGKTLIGHALKNDLAVLNIRHPWQFTRDTAKYEPFMKQRFDDGIYWPRKLKDLAYEHLQADIQLPGQPHSALEDAVAALRLYQWARTKWEKVMQYKIRKTAEIEQRQTAWPALSSVAIAV